MLYILRDGLSGIADPMTPDSLALSHTAWGDEIRNVSWAEVEIGGHRMYSAVRTEHAISPDTGGLVGSCSSNTIICGSCTSSLDVARVLARDGVLNVWDSVLAVTQTSGRGQLRRPWSSPAGNIYSALRLPYGEPHLDDFASLTVGYLFAEAFHAQGVCVKLKWPNDLLLDNHKIGGMLLEDVEGMLMAGVGINVVSSPPSNLLRDGWAVPAGSLCANGCDLSVLTLWQTLVNRIRFCYDQQVVRYNREELTRRLQLHLAWVGRDIIVYGGDEEYRPGRLLGVNENGALRLLLSGHECAIYSGSISLSSHNDLSS